MIRGHLGTFVLRSLAQKPMSGYSLMKSIGASIGAAPSTGSMYPLLEKMKAEGFIDVRKEERSKVYSLNDKGRERLHELGKNQDELLDKLREGFRAFHCLSNKDTGFAEELFDSLKRGEVPFKEINPEAMELKRTLLELLKEGKIRTNRKEIKRILHKTTGELKRL